ncbi:hypothetical protein TPHA_0F01160 [Tetrapisispora phaffii CBS 4417]|uniref:Arrestin C-terminal-like domain-containing protein n=1 Tax=Tetrapisispora phaffii (strain ATCC 24235 / CBS 4417 / NBRC 1672 / NRRL Y-8282 / UCD 70-5) TaxID=1071381 RepID=G8BV19_TETPH|nr:hypothetical protein TPHA_0F01160 [Tetrapisispora phaffii CBS 4417]CCE63601.1 hypothetical protein TPHA_0F01160 [Tetrapisispora phaffii CBS 4417]
MFSKTYLTGASNSAKKAKSPVVYLDIRVDSPYKDIIILQGSPLETDPYILSGKLVFSLNDDVVVKKVSLKFTGVFKLEFMQYGRFKNAGKLASVIKEKDKIFEATFDNLLISPQGTITIGSDTRHNSMYNTEEPGNSTSNFDGMARTSPNVYTNDNARDSTPNLESSDNDRSQASKSKYLSSGLSKLIKKSSFYGANVLELPISGTSGTPYAHMREELNSMSSSTQIQFQLQKGNYELPFKVMLPREIPETIEGLQSASILYNFEAHIERARKAKGFTSIIRDDNDNYLNENLSLAMTGTSSNMSFYTYKCFKYMRIFRTLSFDNLAIQEEMKVGNTWANKLQYEVSIPSRAIPIGGYTPISIKIFPFQKNYKLEKITATLVQFYSMKDCSNTFYDDSVNTFKQSMTDFDGFVTINERTGTLIEKVEIDSMIKIPDDLKKLTQDCDIVNELVQVRHKLTIQIFMKRIAENGEQKTLEIKANLPVLLYVSPQFGIKGRYVILDKIEGNIHFRSGKFVNLFNDGSANDISGMTAAAVNNSNPLFVDNAAPPNYRDRTKDKLIHYNTSTSTGMGSVLETQTADTNAAAPDDETSNEPRSTVKEETRENNRIIPLSAVPTYEQTMNETTVNASTGSMTITTITTTPGAIHGNVHPTTTTTRVMDNTSNSAHASTTTESNAIYMVPSHELAPRYY